MLSSNPSHNAILRVTLLLHWLHSALWGTPGALFPWVASGAVANSARTIASNESPSIMASRATLDDTRPVHQSTSIRTEGINDEALSTSNPAVGIRQTLTRVEPAGPMPRAFVPSHHIAANAGASNPIMAHRSIEHRSPPPASHVPPHIGPYNMGREYTQGYVADYAQPQVADVAYGLPQSANYQSGRQVEHPPMQQWHRFPVDYWMLNFQPVYKRFRDWAYVPAPISNPPAPTVTASYPSPAPQQVAPVPIAPTPIVSPGNPLTTPDSSRMNSRRIPHTPHRRVGSGSSFSSSSTLRQHKRVPPMSRPSDPKPANKPEERASAKPSKFTTASLPSQASGSSSTAEKTEQGATETMPLNQASGDEAHLPARAGQPGKPEKAYFNLSSGPSPSVPIIILGKEKNQFISEISKPRSSKEEQARITTNQPETSTLQKIDSTSQEVSPTESTGFKSLG